VINLRRVGRLERVKPIFSLVKLWREVFSLACALKTNLMRGWLLGRPVVRREKALRRKKPTRVAVLIKV
jgi:hypothetical protein